MNVTDSIVIGEKMEREYIASLPNGFYNSISSPIKTMSLLKKQTKGKGVRPVIDLKRIFLHLLMIGQQWEIRLEHIFTLCCVQCLHYLLMSTAAYASEIISLV